MKVYAEISQCDGKGNRKFSADWGYQIILLWAKSETDKTIIAKSEPFKENGILSFHGWTWVFEENRLKIQNREIEL